MGYCLSKNVIIVGRSRRIFFKRQNIARLFYPLAVFACFFALFSFALPALAVETTRVLPFSDRAQPQPSHMSRPDSCRSFLDTRLSPDAKGRNLRSSKPQRVSARSMGKNPAPIALSLYLGVRIARGPQETSKVSRHDFQKTSLNYKKAGGHPRALAIAAYRACKNEENLKRYHKNKKQQIALR